MSKVNYKSVLNTLIRKYPHDLEAFRKIKENIKLDLETIIDSNEWSVDEKIELLNIFEHKLDREKIRVLYDNTDMLAIDYAIRHGYYDSYEAIIRHSYTVKEGIIKLLDISIKEIKERKYSYRLIEKRITAIINLINSLSVEERKELFKFYIPKDNSDELRENNLLYTIIKFADKRLIETVLEYVDDINLSLPWAVKTCDTEIVNLYLELGADPFYEPNEKFTSAIKTAIEINHYPTFALLIEKCKDKSMLPNLLDYASVIDFDNKYHESPTITFEGGIYDTNLIYESSEVGYNRYYRYQNDMIDDRRQIINSLWDKKNEENEDYDNILDVLMYSIICKNVDDFNKYADIVIENKISIDLDKLIDVLLYRGSFKDMYVYDAFASKFGPLYPELDLHYKVMKKILDNKFQIFGNSDYVVDETAHILYKVKEENRKSLIIVPYAQDVGSLMNLLRAGFDLYAHEEGKDCLFFKTLFKWCYNQEVDQLCNYIITNYDINIVDKENHNPMECILAQFKRLLEPDFYRISNKKEIKGRLIDALRKMSKKTNEEIIKNNLGAIDALFAETLKDDTYGHHLEDLRPLILELAKHNIKYSDTILKAIEDTIIYIFNNKEKCEESADIDTIIEFYFSYLDNDNEMGNTLFFPEYQKYLGVLEYAKEKRSTMDDGDITELLDILKEFNKTITEAKRFLKKHISKKHNPKFFKDYMLKTYTINYNDLDSYINNLVRALIPKLSETKNKIAVLKCLTNFDVNTIFNDFDTDLPEFYFEMEVYDRDENDEDINVEGRFAPTSYLSCNRSGYLCFDGNLLEYAILTNDTKLFEYLLTKKAKLPILDSEGNDITMNYVSSDVMEELITSKAYTDSLSGLHNEDARYLQKILSNPEYKQS